MAPTYCGQHGDLREAIGALKQGMEDVCSSVQEVKQSVKALTEELKKAREEKARSPFAYWGVRGGGIAGISALVDLILRKLGI